MICLLVKLLKGSRPCSFHMRTLFDEQVHLVDIYRSSRVMYLDKLRSTNRNIDEFTNRVAGDMTNGSLNVNDFQILLHCGNEQHSHLIIKEFKSLILNDNGVNKRFLRLIRPLNFLQYLHDFGKPSDLRAIIEDLDLAPLYTSSSELGEPIFTVEEGLLLLDLLYENGMLEELLRIHAGFASTAFPNAASRPKSAPAEDVEVLDDSESTNLMPSSASASGRESLHLHRDIMLLVAAAAYKLDTSVSRAYLLRLFKQLADVCDASASAQHQRTLCIGALLGLRARDAALVAASEQLLERWRPRALLALNIRLLRALEPPAAASPPSLSSAPAPAPASNAAQTPALNAEDACARALRVLEAAQQAPSGVLVGRRPIPILCADVLGRLDQLFASAPPASRERYARLQRELNESGWISVRGLESHLLHERMYLEQQAPTARARRASSDDARRDAVWRPWLASPLSDESRPAGPGSGIRADVRAAGFEQYVGSKSSVKQRIAAFTFKPRARKPRDLQ